MANPTTNFGWVMPTSSSLVTNLPADFNTFGQAVDTSMSELLGGTTGQVLSKTSATNMDFTWVTPTDQTPLTTKGDLFTFTTVDARLAVGNNGETLVADSSTSTGLRWQGTPSASNPVLNSAMQNWQRGTTFASSATYFYTADRWGVDGGATGRTISRQVTGDTTNLPFIQYCTRVQRDSGNAATTRIRILQPFETVNTIPLAGKTITFSWYARAGANYSAAAGALGITVYAGTGTDENPRTGTYTGQTLPINTAVTLTTTWQRFSQTVALASTVTEITPMLYQDYVGTAGAADYFDFTGFQIDIGSVALPFRTYAATIQGELAACQRYYNRLGNTIGNSAQRLGVGPGANSTVASVTFYLPVNLRTATTSVDFSGLQLYQGTATYAVTAVAINAQSSQNPNANLTVASGLTGGQFYEALTTTTAGYIAFNAEL